MANEIIKVTCAKCGHEQRVTKPAKPGTYQFTCKDCGNKVTIQLRPKPIQMEGQLAAAQAKPAEKNGKKQQIPVLGKPVPVPGKGVYCIKTPAKLDKVYGFICPECGKPVLLKVGKPGVVGVSCKKCQTKTFIKVVEETAPAAEPKKQAKKQKKESATQDAPRKTAVQRHRKDRSTGMLTWGNIFRRKKFVLSEGSYTLGRRDSDYPSDIQFDDNEMSRRSVLLEVMQKPDGFYYKLTVKKATNPVLHNNKVLDEDESVYLNFGDAFQIGRTVINFKKVDK